MSMGKPFQSTINLVLRLGDKIHPIFNNYLLNFKHSGFSDYLLTRRELRFKLTHRAGLPDQTQGKQRLIWALSFTRCCKDRSYDVLQKWQRELGHKGRWQARRFRSWTRGSGHMRLWVRFARFCMQQWERNLENISVLCPQKVVRPHDILWGARPHVAWVFLTGGNP